MRWTRLRHVADVNPTSPRFEKLAAADDVTFLPMESVWPDDRLDLSRQRAKGSALIGYTRFQDGDILVPKITPTFEAGRSVLISGLHNGVGAGTTELHVLRPGREIDARFLLYLTRTHPFLKFGEAEMYGVAGQKRVPDDYLRDLPIDLLPLSEQRQIADFLDDNEARFKQLTSIRHEQLRLLDEYEFAARDELVEELFDKFGDLPLRRYCSGIEQGVSPQCEARTANQNQWGVLKLSSVKHGAFIPSENKRLPDTETPVKAFEVREGDLLVTRANTPDLVGDVAVVGKNSSHRLLPDLIYRVNLTPEMASEFVAQVALSGRIRAMVKSVARGSSQSMVKLRGEDIRQWPIPRADQKAQKQALGRFAEDARFVNLTRNAIKAQTRLLNERRIGLISAAITGQFDVSTAREMDVP